MLLATATPPRSPSSCGLARTSTQRSMCVCVACEGVELESWLTGAAVLQGDRTALTLAALNGHTDTVAALVRLGADIHTKDNVRACSKIDSASTHPG
jgi:hypothetical protein